MDKRFILLNFGTSNKKIAVSEELSYDFIKNLVENKFQISNPQIQYFDNDVDDYVDFEVESVDDIQEYKIIKMKISNITNGTMEQNTPRSDSAIDLDNTPALNCLETTTPPRCLNTPVVANNKQGSTLASSCLQTPVSHSNMPAAFPADSPSSPYTQASTSSRPDTPATSRPDTPASSCPDTPAVSRPDTPLGHLETSGGGSNTPIAKKVKQARKPWPKTYRLPKDNIPRAVREKLDTGKDIGCRDRSLLMDTLYHDATQYDGGLYPTSEMYDSIVDSLVREYPYILVMGGLPTKSAREFWKDKLVFKFGNSRKRLDRDHPEVVLRKKKAVDNTVPHTNEPLSFVWGLARYSPPLPVSEDETSQEIHIGWLKREFKKGSADMDINTRNLKMDLTFSTRRKMIVEEKVGVKELLETFPWLQSRQEILKEFQRLKPNTPQDDLEELLSIGLVKYRDSIIKLIKGKKKPKFLCEMEDIRTCLRNESQRNYADDCIALIGILILLKEKPEKVICLEKSSVDCALVINVKEKVLSLDNSVFSVVIDGITIFDCDNFFEAFSGLVGCIYVFNLAYPKPWEKFLTFIQNVVMGLKDEDGQVNFDRRILSVLSSINSEINKA